MWGGNRTQSTGLSCHPHLRVARTFLRRNDVNGVIITTPSFEELGPQLEGTAVTNSVHTPCLPAKGKQGSHVTRLTVTTRTPAPRCCPRVRSRLS